MDFLSELAQLEPDFFETIQSDESHLQCTDKWLNDRKGKFTGSKIKELMGTSKTTSKMEWGRAEKIIDLNETSIKYIFSRAMERKREKIIRTPSTKAMRFGKDYEKEVFDYLANKYPRSTFESVGFVEFIPGIAGASPDGKITNKKGDISNLEIKITSGSWNGLYDRHYLNIGNTDIGELGEKHIDFWQINAEMLALQTDYTLYAVAEPPEDLDNPEITDISRKYIKASKIHQSAIIQRCMLGENIIKEFLSTNNFQLAVANCCEKF